MNTSIIPIPRVPVSVRVATAEDLPFVDSLQKMHGDRVGFLQMKALEGKINAGQVLVAEHGKNEDRGSRIEDGGERSSPSSILHSPSSPAVPLGYVIGQDRYLKREDCGIIFHLNVVPSRHRGFVGATMLKAVFDRAAYGCKLFCCWCAQDIEANRFWESMGFVPLAYRAGGEKKLKGGRVHIFWQKRIREGDRETPWWYPSQTNAGAMGEDRLVLPIPPGKHWADEMPVIVRPGAQREPRALASGSSGSGRPLPDGRGSQARPKRAKAAIVSKTTASRRLSFAPVAPAVAPKGEKKPREKKPKAKNDPKLVAAARELRDRWLEHVNAGEMVLEGAGKYDLTRALPDISGKPSLLLPAAA